MGTHSRKTPADPNLALRIEVRMLKKDLSGADVATAVSRSEGAVSHWITGRYEPPRAMIPKLAKVLEVSVGWLMGENLTEAEKAQERRYLEHLKEGGEELMKLMDKTPLEELLTLLREHDERKKRRK